MKLVLFIHRGTWHTCGINFCVGHTTY